MAGYTVGSVNAKIVLDTSEFKETIKTLKGDIKGLKSTFNQKTGGKGLVEDVSKLKTELDSLREKTENYKKTIKTLRESNKNYADSISKLKKEISNFKKSQADFNKELESEQKNLDNVSKSAKQYIKLADRMTKIKPNKLATHLSEWGMGDLTWLGTGATAGGRHKYADFSQWTKQLNKGAFKLSSVKKSFDTITEAEVKQQAVLETLKMAYNAYDLQVRESAQKEKMAWATRQSAMRNAMETFVSGTRQMQIEQMRSWGTKGGYSNYLNTLSRYRAEFEKVSNVNSKLSEMGKTFSQTMKGINESTTLVRTEHVLQSVTGELEKLTVVVGRTSDVLKSFDFQLLALADTESIAYKRTVELASAIQKMNVQGTGNWQGRNVTGGYSTFISQSKQIEASLKRQAEEAKLAKRATEGLSQAYSKINLNTYKSNINQVSQALEKQKLRTAQLEAAQQSLYYKNAPNNLNTYKMNMDKINQSIERQTGNYKKSNDEIKKGTSSLRAFGTNMSKSEAYSNNLYRGLQKVRSVIVSMRTIMGAMGGMAIWNFAFELVDKAKETYSAKNEMESLLNRNSHVNAEGIQYFNKALDDTVAKFQRINKYSLGETAANIGLEFNLNAKEMAKSLDVISMVQNEYIRAGRTTEEASLAVKDILQGEFQRLSRETGVGKDDLKDKYGWNGSTEDVQGLMRALEKAGKARHWDTFAEKATSVNDVITITQNRFGEFGADLITNIEPMIVGAFNGILDVVGKVKGTFEGMGSFGKLLTIGVGGTGALVGASSLFLAISKGIGLADIATIGWSKSLLTATFQLNKADVAQHGFLKTLLAANSGVKAGEVANIGFGKSLAARVLGLKHADVAEQGLLNAMVKSRVALKGESFVMDTASLSSMKLHQKLAYLSGGMKLADAQSAGFGRSLLGIATSAKVVKTALLGIMGIGILAWFASVANWTDTVKKRMETYKDILANGKDEIADAKKDLESYDNKLANLSKSDAGYELAKKNRDTVQNHINDLELSLKLAKQIKKTDKEISKAHDTTFQGLLDDAYSKNGVDIEKYGQTYLQVKQAAYDVQRAEDERYHFLYQSSQHINQQVDAMQKAKVNEEARVKYITEYSSKAQEAAENLKKFNEGDLNAGVYYLINRAQLMWIDLWNNQHFLKFWESVKKTWEDIKPTIYGIKDTLISLGEGLADFFSTDIGRWIGTIGLFGTGIGLVGLKIGKWVTGSKSVFEVLKKVGGKLKDVGDGWKKVADNAEEANKKMGGEKSTGGIAGGSGTSKTPFKDTLKSDAQMYARAAVGIAAGMLLITEAIVMLKAPMWGLAEVGKQFKADEPNIREGIEGLKLVAPIIGVLLPPVVAVAYILEKFNIESTTIIKGAFKAAVGIAVGMLLVAETITMIIPSIWALGALGDQYKGIQSQVKKGTEAMRVVSDSLKYLAPFIPALALGVTTIALAFANPMVGAIMGTALTLGIPIGMLWVAETIWSLEYPLQQIGNLGSKFTDLSNVRQGAEAIRLTAEALGYVEQGMRAFALIAWDSLATSVANLIGVRIGVDLTQLTGEDGFFSQLETFTKEFNKISITSIDQDKVTTLTSSATGLDSVKTALVTVKDALKDLPNFEVDTRSTNQKYQDSVSGETSTTGITNYFEQLKEPITQLNDFISNFNQLEIEEMSPDKVALIQTAATGISTMKTAIDNVKAAMGSAVDTEWAANMATGGVFGAVGGYLFGNGGASSSIKGGLDELYNSVKDIMDFNTRIAGLTSEGSGNANAVAGASNMVSALQTQINNLKTTLTGAVPTVKSTAKGMGTAIVSGVSEGLATLSTTVATSLSSVNTSFKTAGENWGNNVTDGFKSKIKIKDTASAEIGYTFEYLDGKVDEFYTKGANLGDALSRGFKDHDGLDQHSPGRMARAVSDELGFIGDAFSLGNINLPQMASGLAQTLSSNFAPTFNIGNLQLPNLDTFQQGLQSIPSMVGNVKSQVLTNFSNIQTGIGGSFSTIVTNTRSSLSNMQAATIKNIGNIKTSWRGMQTALIGSAENIRKQTGEKINNLKTNMGNFWKKIQNPSLLLGSAGGHTGSIRRRNPPKIRTPKGAYAGGFSFKPQRTGQGTPDFNIAEYIKCMMETGSPCFAGGWNFNWNKSIQGKFNGWNTNFGKWHIDDHVKAGKFYNNNFPIKGIAEIAKAYIYDTISATTYGKYFNSKFGEDPIAALRAGVFNCWDGTNIVLALASAFGFTGAREHGTWNGIGHVWANIPGLGIIDPTAIQNGQGFKSPSVKGYSAGSIKRNSSGGGDDPFGETHNYGDIHITINNNGEDVTVNEKRIDRQTGKKIYDLLGVNPATGR